MLAPQQPIAAAGRLPVPLCMAMHNLHNDLGEEIDATLWRVGLAPQITAKKNCLHYACIAAVKLAGGSGPLPNFREGSAWKTLPNLTQLMFEPSVARSSLSMGVSFEKLEKGSAP